MSVSRDLFLLWVHQAVGVRIPYVWGGKNPMPAHKEPWASGGLDCSGLVTYALHLLGGPDLRGTHNTDRLWTVFPRVELEYAMPGDLVLYRGAHPTGPDDVEHVMVYAGTGSTPRNGIVIGQAYGGRANTCAAYSLERGHWTKALGINYRHDLAGVVRMPFS